MSLAQVRVLKDRFRERSNELHQRQAEFKLLSEQREEEQAKVDNRLKSKLFFEQVIDILSKTSDKARETGRLRMEKVATKALQSIFGPSFEAEIEIVPDYGGKPGAFFYVKTQNPDGTVIRNEPQESRGGGVNDIYASALQVATMVVYNDPKIMGPILLDEPGKHVSEDYIIKYGEFLAFISKTFGRQITMVTHQAHLAQTADKMFVSQLIGGKTVLKEILDEQSKIDWDAE